MEKVKQKLTIEDIKSRIKIVCICKGIKQSTICDAIVNGCDSLEKVNTKTKSGSGGCKGRRCAPVIQQIIHNNGKPLPSPHPNPEDSSLPE